MNIYLPIEVKVRELEGKTLLAMVAAEKGHTVILGEKKDTLSLAQKPGLPPGIVHDKSLTPGEYKIKGFANLKKNGHAITAQDEESGLLDESYDRFANRRFSEDTVSMVDKVFAWGEHDQSTLHKIYPKYTDTFVATGSPRVDFWRSDFDDYYKDSVPGLKSYILVASNFGSPIEENTFWDRMARMRKAGYFDRDPKMEKYLYENTAYQFRLLRYFLELIRELSQSFPKETIVVRPHPVESVEAWGKILGEYPNVIIKREGTITGWIRNAAVVLHNGCTSALEAAVSQVPRIAYRPIPHDIERVIPNNVSFQAFSLDEAKQMVADILEKGTIDNTEDAEQSIKEILENRLTSLSGPLAADRIVDEWENLAEANGFKTSPVKELMGKNSQEKASLARKLKRRIAEIKNTVIENPSAQKKNGKLLKSGHKFPSLSDEEVNSMIVKLKHTLHRFENVKAVRFGEKSFIFYSEN